MAYVQLSHTQNNDTADKTTMLVFLEGTVFETLPFLHLISIRGYQPIGRSVDLLDAWASQGAQICYCTYVKANRIGFIRRVLKRYCLPGIRLYFRDRGQSYANIVEQVRPDILIEDDCKSIGGPKQMCITKVTPKIRAAIQLIVVPEFSGLDALSPELYRLRR